MENTTTWIHENKFGLACGRSPPCMWHQNNMSFMFLGVCKINYLRVSKLITLCTRKSTELSSFPKFAEMAKSLCHTCWCCIIWSFNIKLKLGVVYDYLNETKSSTRKLNFWIFVLTYYVTISCKYQENWLLKNVVTWLTIQLHTTTFLHFN